MLSFGQTVSAAIRDVSRWGYDSPERIAHWAELIRASANDKLGSSDAAARKLTLTLNSTFDRLLSPTGLGRRHRGLTRFQIERLRPVLRTELDRRVLAGRSILELKRDEAVEKAIRLFIGWATSIPAGGSSEESSRELRNSLTKLTFENSLLFTDQANKLSSNISSILAENGDAIAGLWQSNYRVPGYKFRQAHRHRDGEVHLIRGSWALKAGFVRKNGVPYTDEIEAPCEWPGCKCWYVYFYDLNDIPSEFLTSKGRAVLAEARKVSA